MRKKWSLGLMSVTLLASSLMVTPAFCASNVKVEYANCMTQAQSNTISCKIKLTNTSGQAVSLEDYTLRYYYTKDQELQQYMWCDNAAMIAGGNYQGITQNVQGTFYDMAVPTETADTYLEIGFAEGTGTLAANGTVEIQLRITNANWQNYNQSNDFSYDQTTSSYTEYAGMPLYENGVLISGQEPAAEGTVDSEVAITTLSYDKNEAVTSDVSTQMSLNGNVLDGVKQDGTALAADSYTLSEDGTLTFNTDYLNSLAVGTYKYVLDFSAGKDVAISLNVVDTTDYDFAVVLPEVTAKTGDEVEMLVKIQNITSGINNIDFSLKLDTEAFEFLEAVPTGIWDTDAEYEGFYASYHQEQGTLNVMYADKDQNGQYLITEDGAFMRVKVIAKKDFTGAPLTLGQLGAVADYNLSQLAISFKTK